MTPNKPNGKVYYLAQGFFSAMLLFACAGTAMAASGVVSFNAFQYQISNQTIAEKGEYILTDTGAEIPASISYTDETGGITNYIPVRQFAELFDMDITWENESFDVDVGSDLGTFLLPIQGGYANYEDTICELEMPITPQNGEMLISVEDYVSNENYEEMLEVDVSDGRYISVIVTNTGDHPLRFGVGIVHNIADMGTTEMVCQVPAGETVVRTIELLADELGNIRPYFSVGYPEGSSRIVHADIKAVQFD